MRLLKWANGQTVQASGEMCEQEHAKFAVSVHEHTWKRQWLAGVALGKGKVEIFAEFLPPTRNTEIVTSELILVTN